MTRSCSSESEVSGDEWYDPVDDANTPITTKIAGLEGLLKELGFGKGGLPSWIRTRVRQKRLEASQTLLIERTLLIESLPEDLKKLCTILATPSSQRTVDELETMMELLCELSNGRIAMVESIKSNSVALMQICQCLQLEFYHNHQAIVKQGDVGEAAYIMLYGHPGVDVYRERVSKLSSTKGASVKEHLCRLPAPCSFGELALQSDNSLRVATIRATKDVICATIQASDYKRYVTGGERTELLKLYTALYGTVVAPKSILNLSFRSSLITRSSRAEIITGGESATDGDLYIIIEGSCAVMTLPERDDNSPTRASLPFRKPVGSMNGVWSHKRFDCGQTITELGVHDIFGQEALLPAPATYEYSVVCNPQCSLAKINAHNFSQIVPRWERQKIMDRFNEKRAYWTQRIQALGKPRLLSEATSQLPLDMPRPALCAITEFNKCDRKKRRQISPKKDASSIWADPVLRASLGSLPKKESGVFTHDNRTYQMNSSICFQSSPIDILYSGKPPRQPHVASSLGFMHQRSPRKLPGRLPLVR